MSKSTCTGCGRTFVSVSSFDLHRAGRFTPNERRCLSDDEMRARGMTQNLKGWWMRANEEGPSSWWAPVPHPTLCDEENEAESA